jgi:hypothetical protein
MTGPNQRPIRDGGIAGFLAGFVGLIAYYFGVVAWTAVMTRDAMATLLSAFTVIPLMMLLVLALPHALLSILLGIAVAYSARLTGRTAGFFLSFALGICGSLVLFVFVIPGLFPPKSGERDFTAMISNPFAATVYGVLLGWLTWKFLRRTGQPGAGARDGRIKTI